MMLKHVTAQTDQKYGLLTPWLADFFDYPRRGGEKSEQGQSNENWRAPTNGGSI